MAGYVYGNLMMDTRDSPTVFAPTAAPAAPPPPAIAWTERILDVTASGAPATVASWAGEGQRLAVATGLASLFGAAIGLRAGGTAILTHAAGVAAGILAVCGLAVPALAIVLALVNASIDALGLARASSRSAAAGGLLLAGLAPGAALFAVTVEDGITVTLVGMGGLTLAGILAMRSFVRQLAPHLKRSDGGAPRLALVAIPLFLLFASILGARIWWVMLPIVRGG